MEKLRLEVGVKIETLEAVKEGFEVKAYLMAKAKAVLEKPKPRARKTTEKLEVGEDVLHPKLYNALRLWRKEEAMRLGLPAYTVLQQKALLGVANTRRQQGKNYWLYRGSGKRSRNVRGCLAGNGGSLPAEYLKDRNLICGNKFSHLYFNELLNL